MVLPDTAVWVDYLRIGSDELTAELQAELDAGEVLACGPVAAELLAGARASDRKDLLEAIGGVPWADLDRAAWQSVGLIAAELRDQGQVVPLTDIEIAVAARGAGATLWTRDRDFARVAPALEGLELRLDS